MSSFRHTKMERFYVLPAYVKDLYPFKRKRSMEPVLGEYRINTFAEITLSEIF